MAGLAPSGEAWTLKARGAAGSAWPGKPGAGTSRAPRTGREGRARGPRKGLQGEHCSQPSRRGHPPAQGPGPPQVPAPHSPDPTCCAEGREGATTRDPGSESAGTDHWAPNSRGQGTLGPVSPLPLPWMEGRSGPAGCHPLARHRPGASRCWRTGEELWTPGGLGDPEGGSGEPG